jgi:hypothetical protein
MARITVTSHMVAFAFPLVIAARHTAEHDCHAFSNMANECELSATVLALRSLNIEGMALTWGS